MNKLRVLIADDDPIIRLDLRQLLERDNYVIIAEAGDGQEALALAREVKPDVCILDVKMPAMDGIEVVTKLVEDQIAPAILLTAYGDPELVSRATLAGAFAYLVKPFKPNDLGPAIEVARARFEQNRQLATEIEDLKERLETRKLVDRAKGKLMESTGMTESDAYRHLQTEAMNSRRSMREIAESILAT